MIINRRALLQSGAAISTAALVPGLSGGALNAGGPSIERFIFDHRFAYAAEAAQSASALGIELSAIDGDLTSLWYDDLNLRWQQRPMTLAGVTAHDSLFVLSMLAPEYRMRVVHEEELDVAAALPLFSWVIAPA